MNSFIPWMGGKKLLRGEIISRFPADVGRYVEVFGGAGWVLFAKDAHVPVEVYNDADGQLVNLYRVVKYHALELQRELSGLLNAREFFEDFKAQVSLRGMTDIQRAARFFWLIKTSYGADRRSYGCVKRNITATTEYLTAIQQRLQRVVIEHKDFGDLVQSHDRPDTLFYCDPPYVGTEDVYDAGFTRDDHRRLKEVLSGIKGRFILSYNDCELVRELYSGYHIEAIERNNNLTGRYADGERRYREVIIRNYATECE